MAEAIVSTWREIPNTNGLYQASADGSIRSMGFVVTVNSKRGTQIIRKLKGRTLKPWSDANGYKVIYLCGDGRREAVNVHRLVALAFHGDPVAKSDVNHIDGNKQNNSSTNLEWCTRKENMAHAKKTGLWNPSGPRKNGNIDRMKKVEGTPINGGPSIYFESASAAARFFDRHAVYVSMAALGKIAHSLGHYWKYV